MALVVLRPIQGAPGIYKFINNSSVLGKMGDAAISILEKAMSIPGAVEKFTLKTTRAIVEVSSRELLANNLHT